MTIFVVDPLMQRIVSQHIYYIDMKSYHLAIHFVVSNFIVI